MTILDAGAVTEHTNNTWAGIVPVLHDYIAIPNVSEAFDPEWRQHGYMDAAVELIRGWCAARPIPGMSVEVSPSSSGISGKSKPEALSVSITASSFNCRPSSV